MLALYIAAALLAEDLRTRARDRIHGQDGFTSLEWVVIGSMVFAMAILVGAALKAIAQHYLDKIN